MTTARATHHLVLQRKPFAFELFFCWENAGFFTFSSKTRRHRFDVGTFRSRKISYINNYRQHTLLIWKEQTQIHQRAQQINVDIL